MIQETDHSFYGELDQVLDRVYRANESANVDVVLMQQQFRRHGERAAELKDALERLREMREKSQSVWRLKEEISDLQNQIDQLKMLGEQITILKKQLSE